MIDKFYNKLIKLLPENTVVTDIYCAQNFCYVEINKEILGLSFNFSNVYFKNNKNQSINDVYSKYPYEIKIALLNAISQYIIKKQENVIPYTKYYCDPIDLFDFKNKNVLLFGYFKSYIEKLLPIIKKLKVVELNSDIILPEHHSLYVEYTSFFKIFNKFDYFIITGATLTSNKYFEIIETIKNRGTKILVGPTAGILPTLLFETGIDVIGTSEITDSRKVKYHLRKENCISELFKKNILKKVTYKK